MKERRSKIIVLSILAVILAAAGVYIYSYINRFVYNDPNLAGNTAGNINNGGLFCEYNGSSSKQDEKLEAATIDNIKYLYSFII